MCLKNQNDGKKKYYYPDFYLPEYDIVCEVKPSGMLDYGENVEKFHIGATTYNFWIVTEEELIEETFINEVNNFERILS